MAVGVWAVGWVASFSWGQLDVGGGGMGVRMGVGSAWCHALPLHGAGASCGPGATLSL